MEKLDLKKQYKTLYRPATGVVSVVDVPDFNFLMIDGHGDPNSAPAYAVAVQALYALAYTLKFTLKKGPAAIDYPVMPLEGLWWVPDMSLFSAANKDAWLWTMMIMQPDVVTAALVADVLPEVQRKKDLPALAQVRFERYAEGCAAQIMHIGPYSAEEPNIRKVHDFIHERGCERSGKHHEIYLGDPRRTAPEKLQTVVRQPFR